MPTPPDPKLRKLLEELDPTLAPIVAELRRVVHRSAPGLHEQVKWGSDMWTGRSNCITLMVYRDHVNLGFFRGAELTKRFSQLEGTGKGLRHVKIWTRADAKAPVLGKIVRAAAELDRSG